MNNKTKNILVGAVAIASASTPITSLAYNNIEETTSIDSSNTENLEARGGVQSRLSGNTVATSDINLRETASWSGKVIEVIKKGEPVFVTSTSGDFAKVQHDGKTGYVPANYLQATTNNKTVTESVNLRETASWSGNILHVVKSGESVNLISTSGDFSKVQHNGKTGYIPTKYISGANNGGNSGSSTTNNKKVTESVNLRETASWSGNIIHVIKSGETVNVLSTSGDFSKVQHNGKTGYIPAKYVGEASNGGGTVTPPASSVDIEVMNKTGKVVNLSAGDTLNVRSGTNSNTALLGKLSAGSTVKITGRDKITGWFRIDFNGKTGYVGDHYIQIVSEQASVTYKKTTANLNMRTGPSTSNSIITKIPEGTVVKVISSSNGWDYVEYDGQKGYCSNSYLVATNETPTVKKITTTNVNFRKGPGTNYAIISTISANTVVDILSTSGDWAKVKYNGQEGYIHTDYLKTYTGESTGGGGSLPSSKPSYSRVKIVVDAGHGGHDAGAVAFGRREKDIALAISKKVNADLKTLGFQTIMTRSTDVYIPLSERYGIANRNNADMFVSIHLNSGPSTAYGIETLYKNSKTFASNIQTEIIKSTGARDRGLKYRSDLAVLNGSKMPASLVETGFISNSSESSSLASGSYQDKLASSISKGIAKYTDNNISK
mgnify:CR=1 FL=1